MMQDSVILHFFSGNNGGVYKTRVGHNRLKSQSHHKARSERPREQSDRSPLELFPLDAFGSILQHNIPGFQLIPNAIRSSPILFRSRLGAQTDQLLNFLI